MTSSDDSAEITAKDRQYLWHAMSPYNPNQGPMVVTQGEGSWITDIEGNRYLDAMSGLWCVNVGYGRQELAEAAYEQLRAMAYYPLSQSHLPAIQLAEKLNEWLEGDYVIFFLTVVQMQMKPPSRSQDNIISKRGLLFVTSLYLAIVLIMVTQWEH